MIESDRVREQAVQKNYVYVVLSRHAAWRDIIGVQCVGGVAFRGAVATLLLGVYLNTYLEFAYLLWTDGASAAAGRTVNTSQTVYKVYVYKGNIRGVP